MTNAESVKARLKNFTAKDGGTMQDKLTIYALERSIYRLSISKYADRFILKGGIFLYALRIPEAVQKIIKGTNTGSITNLKTTKNGIERIYFKLCSPICQ